MRARPGLAPRAALRGAAMLALATLACSWPGGGARADTLVEHVDGITPDGKGGIAHFTGLLIGDDGRIELVLRPGDKPPRATYAVDGHGAVLLPGLIDAHVDIMDLGFSALTLDLSDTHSLGEAQARIAAYAAAHPDRPWILGGGWNQESWGLRDAAGHSRFPTATELDAAVADRPVWLTRVDGHAGWANARALALAGVTAVTRAPEGGRIEHLPSPGAAPGRPAGVLVDAAMALVEKVVSPPRPEDRDLALATAQAILISHGVTAVCDMATTIEDWQAFRRAGDEGRLQIRIMAYALGVDAMSLIAGSGPTPWLYDDHLRMGGVNFYADGALGSRGAYLKAPYADAPNSRGLQRLTDTQLKNLMSRAAMDHFQIAVDATGDAANAEVLDAIDSLADTYTGDRRWRIEQAQVVDPADIPRFGKHAIVASVQPMHEASDRLMAEARLGAGGLGTGGLGADRLTGGRLAGAYAWKSVAATGAVLAFGSDAPSEAPDPFAGMAAAISRPGADEAPGNGPVDAVWQPRERVSPEAALAAYTTGAAIAGFAEGRIGRIAPGMRADFVAVDRDPLTATPAELRQTKVLQVWIGGKSVLQASERAPDMPRPDMPRYDTPRYDTPRYETPRPGTLQPQTQRPEASDDGR